MWIGIAGCNIPGRNVCFKGVTKAFGLSGGGKTQVSGTQQSGVSPEFRKPISQDISNVLGQTAGRVPANPSNDARRNACNFLPTRRPESVIRQTAPLQPP